MGARLCCAGRRTAERDHPQRRPGGRARGFAFRHREFFLFPTFFHEQLARVRLSAAVLPEPSPNEIEIRYFARVEEARIMTNWTEVRALQPLHILRESVVRERFDYENVARGACGFRANFSTGPGLAFSRREGVWRVSQLGANCRSRRLTCGFIRSSKNEGADRRRVFMRWRALQAAGRAGTAERLSLHRLPAGERGAICDLGRDASGGRSRLCPAKCARCLTPGGCARLPPVAGHRSSSRMTRRRCRLT